MAQEGQRDSLQPEYGGHFEPTVERNPEFARDAAARGWRAFYQGDFDTAMRRFNQAWMFDPELASAHYGFGLVLGQRALQQQRREILEQSLLSMERALELDSGNARIAADLAHSLTLLGQWKGKDGDDTGKSAAFERANQLFAEATTKAPDDPVGWANWAVLANFEGQRELAIERVRRAQALNYEVPPELLQELGLPVNEAESGRADEAPKN